MLLDEVPCAVVHCQITETRDLLTRTQSVGVQPKLSKETTLELCSTLRFEWGAAGVIPEIPNAVYRSVRSAPDLLQSSTDMERPKGLLS